MFSVCIPAYNTGNTLAKCVDSVLCQAFKDYEIIIVDDGSTDNVAEIADSYSYKHSNLIVLHQENKGLFHARISAMKIAQGDFILSVDSDDWLEPDSLHVLNDYIDNTGCDLVLFNMCKVFDDGTRKKEYIYGGESYIFNDRQILIKDFLNSSKVNAFCRKAIKRDLLNLDVLSAYPRISMSEDWIHSFYPILNATKIGYCSSIIYNYFKGNKQSLTYFLNKSYYFASQIIYKMKVESDTLAEYATVIDFDRQFLTMVSRTLVFSRSRIKNKESYYDYLYMIQQDNLFHEIYSRSLKKVSISIRWPLVLLNQNRLFFLLCSKQIISKIRRIKK